MARTRWLCSYGIVLLVARGAGATPAYPVTARLTLAPKEEQRCLKTADSAVIDCSAIEEAHSAFSAAVARMFTPGPVPNLEFILRVSDVEIFETAGGFKLSLEVKLRVLSSSGEVLDDLTAVGEAAVGEESKVDKLSRAAAENAVHDFELAYSRSQPVADWLVKQKIAPASSVKIPERSDKLISLSVGTGMMFNSGDSDTSVAPSLRLAVSYRWLFLQVMGSHYSSSFQEVRPTFASEQLINASLSTSDLGVEAGAVIRLGPAVELRIGPGIHYLFGEGSGDVTESFSKVSPTVFASFSASFLPFRGGLRFFGGIEGRIYLAATVDQTALGRTVPAANSLVGLFLGAELPWGSNAGSAR